MAKARPLGHERSIARPLGDCFNTIDAGGGGREQVTNTPDDDDFAPTWSPDGTEIAFVSTRSDGRFVYIIGADGGGERVVNGNAGPQFAPAWQPLGDRR